METTMTITQQWQIYLPEAIRRALKLTRTSRLKARVQGRSLVLTTQESPVMKLAGSLKQYAKGKKIDLDNIRDYIDYSDL